MLRCKKKKETLLRIVVDFYELLSRTKNINNKHFNQSQWFGCPSPTTTSARMADKLISCVSRHQTLFDNRDMNLNQNYDLKGNIWRRITDQLG